MSGTVERNKQVVREFYDLAFNQKKPAEATSKYLGATYRQHNPGAADGAKAFTDFVTGFLAQAPQLRVDFKRFVAEGDLVVVHSNIIPAPGTPGLAVMDIFRLEGGKIVEHWDVIQEVPAKAANSNSMF